MEWLLYSVVTQLNKERSLVQYRNYDFTDLFHKVKRFSTFSKKFTIHHS